MDARPALAKGLSLSPSFLVDAAQEDAASSGMTDSASTAEAKAAKDAVFVALCVLALAALDAGTEGTP